MYRRLTKSDGQSGLLFEKDQRVLSVESFTSRDELGLSHRRGVLREGVSEGRGVQLDLVVSGKRLIGFTVLTGEFRPELELPVVFRNGKVRFLAGLLLMGGITPKNCEARRTPEMAGMMIGAVYCVILFDARRRAIVGKGESKKEGRPSAGGCGVISANTQVECARLTIRGFSSFSEAVETVDSRRASPWTAAASTSSLNARRESSVPNTLMG